MRRLSLLLLVIVSSCAALAGAPAERLLARVPDDAALVVLVPSVEKLVSGIAAFGKSVGVDDLADMDTQGLVGGLSLVDEVEGLSIGGPLLLAMSPSRNEPLLMCLVKDGEAWRGAAGAEQTEGGLYRIPFCCDQDRVIPVLFKDEYKWHRKQGWFWRKMPIRTRSDEKLLRDSCSYNVFAMCPGVHDCRRTQRALVCRLFPFEPFLDDDSCVRGLVYQIGESEGCSLVGKPQRIYNPTYIVNAIRVWQELVDVFPEEKDMYMDESRKLRKKATQTGEPVRFFK